MYRNHKYAHLCYLCSPLRYLGAILRFVVYADHATVFKSDWRPYYRHFHTVINQLCKIICLDEIKGPLNNLDCILKTYLPVSQVDNFLHQFPLEVMGNSMTEFVNAHDLLDQRTDIGPMYYLTNC